MCYCFYNTIAHTPSALLRHKVFRLFNYVRHANEVARELFSAWAESQMLSIKSSLWLNKSEINEQIDVLFRSDLMMSGHVFGISNFNCPFIALVIIT